MSLAFLFKKTWHTSTFANQEKVWIAEQKDAAEKKRIAELTKQVEEEREVRELEEMQAAGGHRQERKERIDWMYEGPMQSTQDRQAEAHEYLLGKEFKLKDQGITDLKKLEETKAPGTLFTASSQTTSASNDTFRRVQEDPLLKMRRARIEAQDSVVSNPVKMSRIRQQLEAELAERAGKKRAKREAKEAKREAKKAKKQEKKEKRREKKELRKGETSRGSGQQGERGSGPGEEPRHNVDHHRRFRLDGPASGRDREQERCAIEEGRKYRDGNGDRDRGRGRDRSGGVRGDKSDEAGEIAKGERSWNRDRGSARGGKSDQAGERAKRERSGYGDGGKDRDRDREGEKERERGTGGERHGHQGGSGGSEGRCTGGHNAPTDLCNVDNSEDTAIRSAPDPNPNPNPNPKRGKRDLGSLPPKERRGRYGLVSSAGSGVGAGATGGGDLGPGADLLAKKERERAEREKERTEARRRKAMTPDERERRLAEMEEDGTRNQELKKWRVEQGRHVDAKQQAEECAAHRGRSATFIKKMRHDATEGMDLEERMQRNRHYQQRGADVHNFMSRG
ncbi:unnamed protein product [Discosporangium mesarthrocarpum]